MPTNLEQYQRVQRAAREVLTAVAGHIHIDSTEASIASACVDLLAHYGIDETWYYSVPALVLLGDRSCLSISGRDYVPATDPVGDRNLVTIDLSPLAGSTWGDLARSFPVESGAVATSPQDREFQEGLDAERLLHERFRILARPDRTFEEIYQAMNQEIFRLGFVNLDFLGNVGHSIVERREDRVYFEPGNSIRLGEVEYFTLEPHIRKPQGRWGFKHENIYYFGASGGISEL